MRNRFWTIVIPLALVVMALGLIGFTVMRAFASDRPSDPKSERLQTDAAMQTPDHRLLKSVWQVLRSVPALEKNDTLRVFVKNSVVKLEGAVDDPVQRKAAEKAAASVSGVVTVINLIKINGVE